MTPADGSNAINRSQLARYLTQLLGVPTEVVLMRRLKAQSDEVADPKGFGYGVPFEVECVIGGVSRSRLGSRERSHRRVRGLVLLRNRLPLSRLSYTALFIFLSLHVGVPDPRDPDPVRRRVEMCGLCHIQINHTGIYPGDDFYLAGGCAWPAAEHSAPSACQAASQGSPWAQGSHANRDIVSFGIPE